MTFKELIVIAENVAKNKENDAGHDGARGDYGAGEIRSRLKKAESYLILKMDLRPSEINKVLDAEVGFPYEFSSEIKYWKGMEFYILHQKEFNYSFK